MKKKITWCPCHKNKENEKMYQDIMFNLWHTESCIQKEIKWLKENTNPFAKHGTGISNYDRMRQLEMLISPKPKNFITQKRFGHSIKNTQTIHLATWHRSDFYPFKYHWGYLCISQCFTKEKATEDAWKFCNSLYC
jgi:hypothetical protein